MAKIISKIDEPPLDFEQAKMKYLIVKTSSLGDIIHSFPVANYLKKKFPHAQIDWAVEAPFAELLEAHPLIDRVLKVDTKQWRRGKNWGQLLHFRKRLRETVYDAVFDLQGNIKSSFITAWTRSVAKVGFAWRSVPEWPNLLTTHYRFNPPPKVSIREEYLSIVRAYFSDRESDLPEEMVKLKITSEEEKMIQKILSSFPPKKKVMVCPASTWPNKQMNMPALVRFLEQIENVHFVVIWGKEKERVIGESLQQALKSCTLIDQLSIPVLQNLMTHFDLVIGMDSLPLHLAATTSTPTFSIFGASSARKYQPCGDRHASYQGSCPYQKTFEKRCPILRTCPTGACIRSLTGEEVLVKFLESR